MSYHRLWVMLLAAIMALGLTACSGSDGGTSGGGGTDYTMYSNNDLAGTWSPFVIEVHGTKHTGTVTFDTNGTLASLTITNVPEVYAEGQLSASAGGDISGNMGVKLVWAYLHTSFASQFTVTGKFIDKNNIQVDIGGGQTLNMTKTK